MIVDTGADYTLLPRFLAPVLGIDLNKDCQKLKTSGVGGEERVFFCFFQTFETVFDNQKVSFVKSLLEK